MADTMQCPHCKNPDAVFEMKDGMVIKPVIEGWKYDNPEARISAPKQPFMCIDCGGLVTINLRNKTIRTKLLTTNQPKETTDDTADSSGQRDA